MTEESGVIEILVENGSMTPATAAQVLRFAETWGMSHFHAILQCHVLSETELADRLSRSLRLDRVFSCRTLTRAEGALSALPFRKAKDWEVLPLGETQHSSGRFEVVMADPTRKDRVERLTRWIGRELSLAVAERSDIVGAIDELYPLADQLPGLYGTME